MRSGKAGAAAAAKRGPGSLGRLFLGSEFLEPLENRGALRVELVEADDQPVTNGLEIFG